MDDFDLDWRACAFCKGVLDERHLVKYSTRRYAHAKCLLEHKGMEFIKGLPQCPRDNALELLRMKVKTGTEV